MNKKKELKELIQKQRKDIAFTRSLINDAKLKTTCTLLVARNEETIGRCQDTLRDLSEKEAMIVVFEKNVDDAERFLNSL